MSQHHLTQSVPDHLPRPSAGFKNKKAVLIAAAITIILIALVVAIIITVVHPAVSNSPSGVVRDYYTAINDCDYNKLCACLPPYMRDAVSSAAASYEDKSEYLNAAFRNSLTALWGDDMTISLSDFSEEEQAIASANSKGYVAGVDPEKLGIDAMTSVTCSVTTSGNKGQSTQTVMTTCYKIDGTWYVGSMSDVTPTQQTQETYSILDSSTAASLYAITRSSDISEQQ